MRNGGWEEGEGQGKKTSLSQNRKIDWMVGEYINAETEGKHFKWDSNAAVTCCEILRSPQPSLPSLFGSN